MFTTWHTTVKAANLHRDGRVSLCIDEAAPPFAFVIVEGMAALQNEAPDLLYWATRIAGRYMGEERAGEYGGRNGVSGELLVHITPARVVAKSNVSGYVPP